MDIAIIGIGGRFPGASNVQQFYQNLVQKKDCVTEISLLRKIKTSIPINKDYQLGGYLEAIDEFDWNFFDISLGEAQTMDPQQRIICEIVHDIFDDSGYGAKYFRGKEVAVYVGDTSSSYASLISDLTLTSGAGNLSSLIAGRISRVFDLRGGAYMIDTACSSALVALHQACRELYYGEAQYAVVCGISISIYPYERGDSSSDWGISSPNGKAKSFSAEADGSVSGEAACGVLLKPLTAAIEDGDTIYAIVKGSAVNQDAALSGSLISPDSMAQSEVIRKAWKNAKIDPKTIGYIEAHGTGTKLGDPIEIEGISKAFSEYTNEKQFCAISTVKTNIGHAGSAAGLAGFIKVVLALKYKKHFPSLHYNNNPNRFIDFENSPVFVNSELHDWDVKSGEIRRAGVSSFGLSGTNCHVVLEEYAQEDINSNKERLEDKELLIVSAKSFSSLKENLEVVSAFLKEKSSRLHDIAYSFSEFKEYFNYRCGILGNRDQLIDKLTNIDPVHDIFKVSNVDKVIFVFSEQKGVTDTLIRSFCNYSSVFKETFELCCFNNIDIDNSLFQKLAFQYSFYKLIISCGLNAKYFIGEGIGKIVSEIASGKLTFQEGYLKAEELKKSISSGMGTSGDDLFERISAYIKSNPSERTIFFEVGFEGEISGAIKKVLHPVKHVVICFAISKENNIRESFLEYLRSSYISGYNQQLKFNLSEKSNKVTVPGYKFDRSRVWVEKYSNKIEEWFYKKEWVEDIIEISDRKIFYDGVTLVFTTSKDVFLKNNIINKSEELIFVIFGEAFFQEGNCFYIDWKQYDHFKLLRKTIIENGIKVSRILHLGNAKLHETGDFRQKLEFGINSLFFIIKAFDRELFMGGISINVISFISRAVINLDKVNPIGACLHGLVNSLVVEYPKSVFRCIDIDNSVKYELSNFLELISKEDSGKRPVVIASYRNSKRYVLKLSQIHFSNEPQKSEKNIISNGDVYVITGGASGIGLEVCNFLSTQANVNLIVLGRRSLEIIDEGGETVGRSNVKTEFELIKRRGTKVFYYDVDLGDLDRLNQIFSEIFKRFSKIKGVFHSAGVSGKGLIRDLEIDEFLEILTPKVHGTIFLYEIIKPYLTGSFNLFSSHNSILGAEEASVYGAANTFLDEFARYGTKIKAINWPAWKNTGMWHRFQIQNGLAIDKEDTLSNRDGIRCLEIAQEIDERSIVVSKFNPDNLGPNPFFLVSPIERLDNTDVLSNSKSSTIDEVLLPDLLLSPMQRELANLWCDVLKISLQEITIDSDFFDIGGNSLNGTQIINRISRLFKVKLNFDDLFEHGTLACMADRISELMTIDVNINTSKDIDNHIDNELFKASHGQKRLWFLQNLNSSDYSYNIQLCFKIKGLLDKDILLKAICYVVERHEILRTIFYFSNGIVNQKILAPGTCKFSLNYEELVGDKYGNGRLDELICKAYQAPFDLSIFPLFRISLIKTTDTVHFFSITMHHIISDAWSIDILFREISSVYQSLLRRVSIQLEPLNFQYKDYSNWQNEKLEGNEWNKQFQYWSNMLKASNPVLKIPSQLVRPKIKGFVSDYLRFELNENERNKIKLLAEKHSATPFMIYISLISLLLYKISGENDLIIGTPISGRNRPEFEDQLGFYSNTIPLRIKLNERETIREFIKQIKRIIIDANENQDYPFDLVYEGLGLKRNVSHSPLFDVMVVYQNERKDSKSYFQHDLSISPYETKQNGSQFDLVFEIYEASKGASINLKYNIDIYEQRDVEIMVSRIKRFFETLSLEASSIQDFMSISENELFEEINQYNLTRSELDIHEGVIDRFRNICVKSPFKVAISTEDHCLKYNEVDELSDLIANFLILKVGLKKGDKVALRLDRSTSIPITIIGILKAGGVYVPIDPDLPNDRALFIVEDCNAALIIFDRENKINDCNCPQIEIGSVLANADDLSNFVYNVDLAPNDLVYIIYTSGTSGLPKGVMIEQCSLINRLDWMWKEFNFKTTDIVMQKTSYAFDVSVWELLLPLCYGAQMAICSKVTSSDPKSILHFIRQQKVNTLHFVPSMLNVFLRYIDVNNLEYPIEIQRVFSSGEKLEAKTVDLHYSKSKVPLYNLYGPTEATIDVTFHKTYSGQKIIPIGLPISNVRLYILDKNFLPVPKGIIGELAIGGVALARGYINNSELTNEKFIQCDFDESKRIYLTGDRCYRQDDGAIVYIDRLDEQVKINGYRIEPNEIKVVLLDFEGINDAIVLTFNQEDTTPYLACFCVSNNVTQAKVRNYLSSRLPAYMIPRIITIVKELPLNNNGKVDIKELLLFKEADVKSELSNIGSSEKEDKIKDIWMEVLKLENIGVDENFFELGGNSIMAAEMTILIKERLSLDLDLYLVFEFPTISGIVKCLKEVEETKTESLSSKAIRKIII